MGSGGGGVAREGRRHRRPSASLHRRTKEGKPAYLPVVGCETATAVLLIYRACHHPFNSSLSLPPPLFCVLLRPSENEMGCKDLHEAEAFDRCPCLTHHLTGRATDLSRTSVQCSAALGATSDTVLSSAPPGLLLLQTSVWLRVFFNISLVSF